jgi:response regulator RpfG family c-di-GMP phosphodiesterase
VEKPAEETKVEVGSGIQRQEKVLVVDDEISVSKTIRRLLNREGYEVVELNDPMKVEDQLLYNDFDLVITDLKMPNRNGIEVLQIVRMSKPELPVIILTAYGAIETAVEATKLGAAEYLTKPFENNDLVYAANKHARAYLKLPGDVRKMAEKAKRPDQKIADDEGGRIALDHEIVATDTIPDGYVEVRFDDVIPGEKIPFSIYIQIYNKRSEKYYLKRICQKNELFTSGLRNILYKRSLKSVYIHEKDYRSYLKFITELKSLEGFRHAKIKDEKKLVLYGKAVEAITEALAQPVNKESVQASINLVDDLFRNMVKNPDLYTDMYQLFKQNTNVFNHCANVSILTISFGIYMKFDQSMIKLLGLGALYHDIGLSKIDKNILEKPEPLTPKEWKIVKQHPEEGGNILEGGVIFPGQALRIVKEHHETSSGKGYPLGLKGSQISNMAKLVRIVDKFESMTTEKPYRAAFTPTNALKQMYLDESSKHVRGLIVRFIKFLGGE